MCYDAIFRVCCMVPGKLFQLCGYIFYHEDCVPFTRWERPMDASIECCRMYFSNVARGQEATPQGIPFFFFKVRNPAFYDVQGTLGEGLCLQKKRLSSSVQKMACSLGNGRFFF